MGGPASALDILHELRHEVVPEIAAEVPGMQLHVPLRYDTKEHLGILVGLLHMGKVEEELSRCELCF